MTSPPTATAGAAPGIGEYRFRIDGTVAVLKLHYEPRPRGAVLVLHGLGASAQEQRPELVSIAGAGLAAVALDAPHHGSRRDGWLDQMAAARPPESHIMLLRLIREALPEVRRAIDHLSAEGHGPVGIVGISMGAYIALAAATEDDRIRATVSILGSPDWSPRTGPIPTEMRALMAYAPVERPADLARHPLLLCNAGRDEHVPARFARDFSRRVAASYPALGPQVHYVEYAESGHFMRPEDWQDVWARTLAFLRAHLLAFLG